MAQKELTLEELFFIDSSNTDFSVQNAYFTNEEFISLMNHLFKIKNNMELYNNVKKALDNYKSICNYSGKNNFLLATKNLLWQYRTLAKGSFGERIVENYLKQYNEYWTILKNINIPIIDAVTQAHDTTENDFVVIANGNIFTIEVKNYSAKKIDVSADGEMTITLSNNKVETGKNAVFQALKHRDAVATLLNRRMNTSLNFMEVIHPIIVFIDEGIQTEIHNESTVHVIKGQFLTETISSYKKTPLTEKEEQKMIDIIQKNSAPDKLFLFSNPLFYFDKLDEAERLCEKEEELDRE